MLSQLTPKYRFADGHRFAPSECQIYQTLEIRAVTLAGRGSQRGAFAAASIRKGAVIGISGGVVLTSIADLPADPGYAEQLTPDLLLAPRDYAAMEPLWLLNHCCEPSVCRIGGLVHIAAKDISAGDQLTLDYAPLVSAIEDGEPSWIMHCACGAASCRQRVSSQDWLQPQLASKLWIEWLPHIQACILERGILDG